MTIINDDNMLFRCGYVSFVALNIAWDYADTVCDISANMQLEKTKPLTRALRALRRRYDSFRQYYVDSAHVSQETHHAEVFMEGNDDVFRHITKCVGDRIKALQPDLDRDYYYLLLAAYQAIIVIKAIRMYAAVVDKLLDEGIRKRHTIIPREALALFELMELYIGDFPLRPGDPLLCRFAQSLYISLSEIEFTESPE